MSMRDHTIGPVTGATAAGAAVVTVLAWALTHAGIDLPHEVQGALTVLVVLLCGWAVPPSRGGGLDSPTQGAVGDSGVELRGGD